VSGCEVYATNYLDPIAFTDHLHRHFGNTSTTNRSTGQSLFNNKTTSCKEDWFTSAGWFPVERGEPVLKVAVYYRAPGDQTEVRAIPTGLQLIAEKQEYSCNGGPFRDTAPFGCAGAWATRLIFPDCWNRNSLQETTTVYSNARGECPSTHPYRIPRINYLIRHPNTDRVVSNPLRVSAGVDSWENYTFIARRLLRGQPAGLQQRVAGPLLEGRTGPRHHCRSQVWKGPLERRYKPNCGE
jgi:hypothetical protein